MMAKMTTSMAAKAVPHGRFARYVHRNNGLQWTDNYFEAKGSSCIIENVSKHLNNFNSIFSLYSFAVYYHVAKVVLLRLSTAVLLRRYMLKDR